MSSFDFYSIEVTCFKSTIVACAALHFYYTVTHFDEEVEYIWSRKWTVGKIIYLLTRYLGTLFLICSVIGVKDCIWNDTRTPDDTRVEHIGDDSAGSIATQESRSLNNFILTCFHGELFSGLGPMIILAAEVILQMRVYALYGRDKRLLAFLILLTISLFGFNILQLSELFFHVENDLCREPGGCFKFGFRGMSRGAFIPDPFVGHHSCLFALPMAGIAWTVAASTEFLLFLLVIIKSRKQPFKSREQGAMHDICASMARDSVAYFAVLFTIYLTGVTIIFVSECIDNIFLHLQVNSYETIAITATTILAPKLIINIRAECSSPSELVESALTWNTDALEYILLDGGVTDSNGADAGRSSSPEPEMP